MNSFDQTIQIAPTIQKRSRDRNEKFYIIASDFKLTCICYFKRQIYTAVSIFAWISTKVYFELVTKPSSTHSNRKKARESEIFGTREINKNREKM